MRRYLNAVATRIPAVAGALVVLLASSCGSVHRTSSAPQPASPFAGHPVIGGARETDFTLQDSHGTRIRLSAQRGRVVILTFLYTQCRDVCPLIATNLQGTLDDLGADRARVRVVAVSVDPENDTPSAVRAFVRAHRLGREFHYLLGTRPELAPVWQAYNVLSI